MTVGKLYRYAQRHAEQLRRSIPNPSEATKLAWRIDDKRREAIMQYYEKTEAAEQAGQDDYEFHITSEVKVK